MWEEAQDSPLAIQVPGPETDHCVINQLSYLTALWLPFFLRVWVLLQPLRSQVRILEPVELLSWPSWGAAPSSPVPSSDILLIPQTTQDLVTHAPRTHF